MDAMISILYANPELVFTGLMAAWGGVEAMGWGFLTDEQRRKAKGVVRKLFGKS